MDRDLIFLNQYLGWPVLKNILSKNSSPHELSEILVEPYHFVEIINDNELNEIAQTYMYKAQRPTGLSVG